MADKDLASALLACAETITLEKLPCGCLVICDSSGVLLVQEPCAAYPKEEANPLPKTQKENSATRRVEWLKRHRETQARYRERKKGKS